MYVLGFLFVFVWFVGWCGVFFERLNCVREKRNLAVMQRAGLPVLEAVFIYRQLQAAKNTSMFIAVNSIIYLSKNISENIAVIASLIFEISLQVREKTLNLWSFTAEVPCLM